ncbi:single-stranded DNA-binding protein [Candidatus Dojkabacteria bacterium]|nr:single-stranded DNA-binding protein [Candidatus Dojkabacteria bacterium]
MAIRSLNKVMLIGNLTRDPESRFTGSGTQVCSFGLATNRSWKDNNGEYQETTEFHNIVAWAKMAEICQQILAKGMQVYIEGSLNTRSWESDDGHVNYRTEIRVDNLILLNDRGKSGAGGENSGASEDVSGKSPEELLEEMEEEESSKSKKKGDKKKKSKGKKKGKKDAKKGESDKDEDPLEDDLPF